VNEFTPHFVPIVILCTLHLAVGFAAGFFLVSLCRREPDLDRVAILERSLRFYRDGLTRLAHQATQASLLSRPELLIEAARAMAKAAREIQEGAEPPRKRTGSKPVPADDAHTITRQEFHGLLKTSLPEDTGCAGTDEGETERHTYSVLQWMGRCCGDRLPPPEDFEEVMCHDLSPKGISFYADDVQIGQSVVLAIGMEDVPMYVLAEVTSRRLVGDANDLTYLVGCRFRRRLTLQADGDQLAAYRRLSMPPIPAPHGAR
jgi:hypothetical protein